MGPSKCNRAPSPLEELPAEILQEIASELMWPSKLYPEKDNNGFPNEVLFASDLFPLRLTCRSVCYKIDSLFARAFHDLTVNTSSAKLNTMVQISVHPKFALAVQKIGDVTGMLEYNNHGYHAIRDHYTKMVREGKIDSDLAQTRADQIRKSDQLGMELSYMERSGTLTAWLVPIFTRLPNLHSLNLESLGWRSFRSDAPYGQPSLSHRASAYMAAIAMSGCALKTLCIRGGQLNGDPGVAVQDLPTMYPYSFRNVREFQITLSTQDKSYRGPGDVWASLPSRFLCAMPLLETLHLEFDHWEDTEQIMAHLAEDAFFFKLRQLHLGGVRCQAIDLVRFLGEHASSVKSLTLRDMDVFKRDTFTISPITEVLEKLKSFPVLAKLQCFQIAADGFRVAYPTLGNISTTRCHINNSEWESEWERVLPQNRYGLAIDDPENMYAWIQAHLDDLEVEDIEAESDHSERFLWYI